MIFNVKHWFSKQAVKPVQTVKPRVKQAVNQQGEFASIQFQARMLVYIYKLVGLYSIPALTLVTIVSMTNVFTSGQFAQWWWINAAWALIFSATIDVNIVRLFVESAIEWKQGHKFQSAISFLIGAGLGAVTGAALLLEGKQQSIGLNWESERIKWVILGLIAVRIALVIVLMAREGVRLGAWLATWLEDDVKPAMPTVKPVKVVEEKQPAQLELVKQTPIAQAVKERDTGEILKIERTRRTPEINALIDAELSKGIYISGGTLSRLLNVSRPTAIKWRDEREAELAEMSKESVNVN